MSVMGPGPRLEIIVGLVGGLLLTVALALVDWWAIAGLGYVIALWVLRPRTPVQDDPDRWRHVTTARLVTLAAFAAVLLVSAFAPTGLPPAVLAVGGLVMVGAWAWAWLGERRREASAATA